MTLLGVFFECNTGTKRRKMTGGNNFFLLFVLGEVGAGVATQTRNHN